MRKYLIKIICSCLVFVFLFQVISCDETVKETLESASGSTEYVPQEYVPPKNIQMLLYRDDSGECFISIDQKALDYYAPWGPNGLVGSFEYNTVIRFKNNKEYCDWVSRGYVTASEMFQISTFYKDEQGRISICDPQDLYVPILPDGYKFYSFELYGGASYKYVIVPEDFSPSDFLTEMYLVHADEVIGVTFFEQNRWGRICCKSYLDKLYRCDFMVERDGRTLYYDHGGTVLGRDSNYRNAWVEQGDLCYLIQYSCEDEVPDEINVDWFFSLDVEKYKAE